MHRALSMPVALLSVTLLAFAATSLLASASLAARPACTVRGTAGAETWTVQRAPAAPGEIAPGAVVCGGPGSDRIRTPGVPFRGVFFGGAGRDSLGTVGRGGMFHGGWGRDSAAVMRGGTFKGGLGADRVTAMEGGRFDGGVGANSASMEVVSITRDDLARRLDVADDRVRLLGVEFVRWWDASLGCPENGRAYPAVAIAGYRVRLAAEDETYVYHTDTGTRAVLAAGPTCQGVDGP